jgi:negative regulator of flagellin synthesis FlgM
MKIHLNIPGSSDIAAQRTSTAEPATPDRARTTEIDTFASDTVRLSSLTAQVRQMPAVRQEKVDALREKVESGSYDIDPQAAAAAMLGKWA